MKSLETAVFVMPIVTSALLASCARHAGLARTDRAAAATERSTAGGPGETVAVVASEPIPNLPGTRLVSNIVDYRPGGRSAPHRHAGSAFVYAYVLSGSIRSQVNDEPVRVYRAGEMWFEKPGSHHSVSENASDTEPARLLAVFIVDADDESLTTPDPQ